MFPRLRSLLRVLLSRRDFETGMAEELRFHIEQYTRDLISSGISAEEAARRARIEFGDLNTVQGECRKTRGLFVFDELRRELRYASRLLWKTPGFTVSALLTLALCLGANLTIFAVIDSVLLRPLPFPKPGRLVTIFNTYPKAGVERDGSSLTNYYERRGRISAFSSLSIYRYDGATVGAPGFAEREPAMLVSPEFFSTLGVRPVIGRAFTEQETTYQTDNVVILTDAYWRQHLNAEPHVIGRQIRVAGFPRTVVGVLPTGFRFLSSKARLYLPLASRPEDRAPSQRHSGGNVIQMIARLKPDATLAQAQSQIDAQNNALERTDPQAKMMADAGFRSLVVPLHADHVASIRPILLLLQAGVLVLLVIGTVNLINLLLVRASARVKEVAVRQALGASRKYVMGEVLIETMLLTLTGALLGLAAGAGGVHVLAALSAGRLPLGADIAFDWRSAFVALAVAIATGLALTGPVAWFHLQGRHSRGLQFESRGGTANRAAQRMRHSFVAAQIALAFILLSGAGMLGLSLAHAMDVSPGFSASHVLTGQITLVGNQYPSVSTELTFTERLVNGLEHQPGMLAAGIVTNLPFSGRNGKSAATIKGRVLRPGESTRGHYSYGVSGDYFRAMGFSLLEGRFLMGADSRRTERVCVVDDDFARYYWPHGSALGHRLFQGSTEGSDFEAFMIVGVVGSVRQAGLTDDTAQGSVYYPYAYRADNNIYVVERGALSPESLKLTLQKVVRRIDPDLSINDVESMQERIDGSLAARRSPALLAGLFAGIALLLTVIGLYGVLSYAVTQRRREIGIRMALGAQPARIRTQFLSLAGRLIALGTIFGILGAWIAGHVMQAVLFHVSSHSPPALAGAGGIIALISLIACFLPANRAARISPREALAQE